MALLAVPDGAQAHTVDPSVVTVIEVDPVVPGLAIDVVTSVSTQLVATNRTDEVLEVLAETGEAFLRIGPDGVEANVASPSWYLSNQPFGLGSLPDGVNPEAPARWARVATSPTWGWFDHRLHPTDLRGGLAEGARPSFRIPMRLGARAVEVRGHLEQRTTVPVFASTFVALPDAATGLVVQLLQGRVPGIFLRWSGEGEVVVTGADGEPFARLGPNGAEVNRRSPTWLFSAQAEGQDLAGLAADPTAAPDWMVVSPTPSFTWLEERAAVLDVATDDEQTQAWTVPLTIAGTAAEITGRSTVSVVALAADTAGGSSTGPRVAVGLAAVGTVALGTWLLRRPGVRGRG